MNLRCFNSFLMFAWLTIGYGVAHVLILFWVFSVVQSLVGSGSSYENLQITSDLEPMIISWDNNSSEQTTRRVDGTTVDFKPGFGPKFLAGTTLSPSSPGEPQDWNYRICALNDFEKPAVYWYFIAPPHFSGTGYFSGYGQVSRQHIGYIDTQGFTRERPTPERSFPVKIVMSNYQELSGTIVGTQPSQRYSGLQEPNWVGNYQVPLSNAALDTVWVLSQDKIYEVHLGSRTIRKLIDNRPDMRFLYQQRVKKEGLEVIQLIVRTDKGVSIIDPKTGQEQTLAFGEDYHAEWEQLYSTQTSENPEGESAHYLIEYGDRLNDQTEESRQVTLMWMDSQGNVERRQQVRLLTYHDAFSNFVDPSMTIFAPLPLISTATILIGPIVAPNELSQSKTYASRVSDFLWTFKFYFPASIVIGLITGWACRRRERDVFGSSSWYWPLLVGVCGWFGWMGYICVRPLPARLPNRAWNMAPPEPAKPLGTEVFA